MADIATLGIEVTSDGVVRAKDRLGDLHKQGAKTEVQANKTSGALGGMGRSAGQAGIQIQQFVGQVQGGVNPMVAFSQQATDLGFVLGFPLLGAVAGIGAALAMTLIPTLFETESATEDLAKKVDALAADYDNLTEAQKRYYDLISGKQIQQLNSELKAYKNELESLQRIMQTPSRSMLQDMIEDGTYQINIERMTELGSLIDDVNGKIADLEAPSEKGAERVNQQIAFLEALREEVDTLGLSGTALAMYKAEKLELSDADKLVVAALREEIDLREEQIRAQNEAQQAAERLRRETEQQERSIRSTIERMQIQTVATNQGRAAAIRYAASIEASKIQNQELAKAIIEAAEAQAQAIETQEANREQTIELKQEQKALAKELGEVEKAGEQMAKGVEDGLVGLISGTRSASNAFSDMARSIINDMIRMQIQQSVTKPLSGLLSSVVGSFFGGVTGNESSPNFVGPIQQRAIGGPVSANEPYLVGERGPELIVPNQSGYVVNNDKLNSMSGGETVIVQQTINLSAGVAQTVRAEVMQMMPQIAAASKQAVLDARKRGGSFAASFGVS